MALVSNMSGHIVGGDYGNIATYPYVAFLHIRLYACGASILNQIILLTAAHCLYHTQNPNNVQVFVGHDFHERGSRARVSKLVLHEKYNNVHLYNDIALLRVKQNLSFGATVGRVILMRHPRYSSEALVCGWGITQEDGDISEYLKTISQVVYNRPQCSAIGIKRLPLGTICGEHKTKEGHPASGDSGGALVIRSAIQIGIVSHNLPGISKTNTVYTDTRYYFEWIKKNAEALNCE